MCPRRHWLYSRLTFCIPTSLSQLIKIAEFLIKTERKICKNTQNILFDGVIYCLRSIYTRKYIFLYPETGPRNRPKFLKKVLRRGKLLIKNKHFAWIIKQLLNMAFWRTSIGRKVFSLLICLDSIKFVLLSVFTLIETTCPKIWAKLPHTVNAQLPHLCLSSIITQNECILRVTVS